MTTELQNQAWRVLPAEFKEEVRNYCDSSPVLGVNAVLLLENLFGIRNLTSDAEGEEMLIVPRSKVMKEHAEAMSKMENDWWRGYMIALQELFGSKCLPDEVSEVKRTLSENLSEPKPAEPEEVVVAENTTTTQNPTEPKFRLKDKVVRKNVSTIRTIVGINFVSDDTGTSYYYMTEDSHGNNRMDFVESDLEPYTELEEEIRNSRISPEAGGSWHASMIGSGAATAVFNDSGDDRRLNIAAMAMQSILSNPVSAKSVMVPGNMDISVLTLAEKAVKIADTLIAECGKGGLQ